MSQPCSRKKNWNPMNGDEWKLMRKRQEQLHPDLAEHLMQGPVGLLGLNHPLVQEQHVDPNYAAHVNRRYCEKLKAIDEAIENCDWSSYIGLHERPHRLGAFIEIADERLSH